MMLRSALAIACLAAVPLPTAAHRPEGVVERCSGQSGASFPHAFTSRDNVVVGPLVLDGAGRFTDAETVRRFHGNKFPVLVAAGHRVTIALSHRTRRYASLGYGPLPSHELTARDGHRVVTFVSCDRKRAASDVDGRPVTFWSGFVLTSRPRCVIMDVWVDRERTPRRAAIPLGRPCP
jgi:hypothetical protein